MKQTWAKRHVISLRVMVFQSMCRYTSDIAYGVLPVVIAFSYGEWVAGLFFGIFNLIQVFLGDPIAGNVADRIGSKPTMLIGLGSMFISALIWILFPMNNIVALAFFGLFFLSSYTFRQTDETYLLRTTDKKEGGIIFGLSEDFYCLARFLTTLSIPFFVIAGNQYLAAWAMIVGVVVNLIGIIGIPNDRVSKGVRKGFFEVISPLATLRNGWNFTKKNQGYPLMMIANALFEGFFYGTIWFVFPLHMVKMQVAGFANGLTLGIYEVIFALTAGLAGFIADRYNWRFFHSFGWIVIAVGVIALPFYENPWWLIGIGIIIALGNSVSNFAAEHALEKYDVDHKQDGAFIAFKNVINDLGYATAPLLAGFLYYLYGFKVSLMASVVIAILMAIWMVWLTWKKGKLNLKKLKKRS